MEELTTLQVTELFKSLLEQQAQLHGQTINAVLGITAVLIGVTGLWNFYFSSRQISRTVKKEAKKISKLVEKKINKKMTNETSDMKKQLENKTKEMKADLARNYALNCEEKNFFGPAVNWWAGALENYLSIEHEYFIRRSVMSLETIVRTKNWDKDVEEDDIDFKSVLKVIKRIPGYFDEEKKIITKALKKTQKRIEKE